MKYQAPLMYHFFGERQIGPGLMHFGSEELKEEFLPKIINAEISFCLGMSEPDAGSDVAAVTTFAREEGDYYIINGQKIWTTNAHNADYIWLLTVTDPDGPKYKNLSEIIVNITGQYAGEYRCVHIEANSSSNNFENSHPLSEHRNLPYLVEPSVGANTTLILWFNSYDSSRTITLFVDSNSNGSYVSFGCSVPFAVNLIDLSEVAPGVGSGTYNYGIVEYISDPDVPMVGQAVITAESNAFEIVQPEAHY